MVATTTNWQITTAALRATLEATERFTVTPDSVSVVDGNICMNSMRPLLTSEFDPPEAVS